MPFTIITLKKVPQSLRGDLSKWMQEIATGVYVGNFNSKVREKLWQRVKENIKDGEATLSYACRNEIGYCFDTLNTYRAVVDLDGIPLVMVPIKPNYQTENLLGFSQAAKYWQIRKYAGRARTAKADNVAKIDSVARADNNTKVHDTAKVESLVKADNLIKEDKVKWPTTNLPDYVVIDIETDGLDEETGSIIELGAYRVHFLDDNLANPYAEEFNVMVKYTGVLPLKIKELTGLTENVLYEEGKPLADAMQAFLAFIGNDLLVGYAVDFDIRFINRALRSLGLTELQNKRYDLMKFVKKENMFLANYKLQTVLSAYGIEEIVPHRALADAKLVYRLSTKVNKFVMLFEN